LQMSIPGAATENGNPDFSGISIAPAANRLSQLPQCTPGW
jgi:hypothetical protein